MIEPRSDGRIVPILDGPIARLVIDNPTRRNAMTLSMWAELATRAPALAAQPGVRVLVLAGAGPHFVSGADIAEFESMRDGAAGVAAYDSAVERAAASLDGLRVPVIAAIRGVCIGGGMALATACDLRIASEDARFAVPAARIGTAYPPMQAGRLASLIGEARAAELLLLGETCDGARAAAIGLVHRCVPSDRFDVEVAALAERLAANAPLSLAAARLAVRAARSDAPIGLVSAAMAAASRCADSDDYKEGRLAFREKRAPRFTAEPPSFPSLD